MKKIIIFLIILPLFISRFSMAEENIENSQEESILHIQNMDVNTLLKSLAIKHKVNIVSSPDLKGSVSLHLKNVNLEETLTAIAGSAGLTWDKEGSVYVIKEKDEPIRGINIKETRNSSKIKSFHINYADIQELLNVIKWSSENSRVTAYSHERILLVASEEAEFEKIDSLVASLDIPPKQALIEAKILEINLNNDTSYGINWGNTYYNDGEKTSGPVFSLGPQSPMDTKPSDPTNFILGLAKPSLHLKLSAMEKEGAVKTLASPRLMVLDGKPAQIIIGGRLGYYVTTTTETSTLQSVEYLDIGTQLKLTPQITEDGHILLNIHPEVSDGSLSGGIPQKTTTAVTTSIMVKTGDTVFIGGLIRNTEMKSKDRIPILGYIPTLGKLFFSKDSTKIEKKELVILLTPHIVTADPMGEDVMQGLYPKTQDDKEKIGKEIKRLENKKPADIAP